MIKMLWKLLLSFLTIFGCIHSMIGAITIQVSPTIGQDSEDCLTDNNMTSPCATLEYALKHSKNSTEIVVLEDTVRLYTIGGLDYWTDRFSFKMHGDAP